MGIIEIFLVAFGLAMDCFAVSVATGVTVKEMDSRHTLRMAASFGAFQALMPLVGWLAGVTMSGLIQGVDHWIAFSLLSFVGLKMIASSFAKEKDHDDRALLSHYTLLVLSLATSIDALAVGISFGLLNTPILFPVVMIGAVTFLVSLAGVWIGRRTGRFFEKKMEIVGGLILIGIGLKIVYEHIFKNI